jgi:hypothetical protein
MHHDLDGHVEATKPLNKLAADQSASRTLAASQSEKKDDGATLAQATALQCAPSVRFNCIKGIRVCADLHSVADESLLTWRNSSALLNCTFEIVHRVCASDAHDKLTA